MKHRLIFAMLASICCLQAAATRTLFFGGDPTDSAGNIALINGVKLAVQQANAQGDNWQIVIIEPFSSSQYEKFQDNVKGADAFVTANPSLTDTALQFSAVPVARVSMTPLNAGYLIKGPKIGVIDKAEFYPAVASWIKQTYPRRTVSLVADPFTPTAANDAAQFSNVGGGSLLSPGNVPGGFKIVFTNSQQSFDALADAQPPDEPVLGIGNVTATRKNQMVAAPSYLNPNGPPPILPMKSYQAYNAALAAINIANGGTVPEKGFVISGIDYKGKPYTNLIEGGK